MLRKLGVGLFALTIVLVAGYSTWYFTIHRSNQDRKVFRESVAESSARIEDIALNDGAKDSAISFSDYFAETGAATVDLTNLLARSRTAPISADDRKDLQAYIVPLRNLIREKEQESRKQLTLSNASDAVQSSLSDLGGSNYIMASVYVGAARRSLADEKKASDELASEQKQTTDRAKKFLAVLKTLRPKLTNYDLVSDATITGFETPASSPPKSN
jgi:hypothetical protein